MSNFTFACASVNGLTLAQKRETVTALRASIKAEIAARKVAKRADKKTTISGFKDATLCTGLFFLDLLDGIKKGVVDYGVVTNGVGGKLLI